MKISKENNQYYAEYFEQAIDSIINNKSIVNSTEFNFSNNEIEELNRCAEDMAKFINGKTCEYVGRKTATEDADLIVDNKKVELKLTSGGSTGTYYNTSINYIPDNYPIKSLKEFMIEGGVYEYLESLFGKSVYDNVSPVSASEASLFMKTHKEEYKILTAKEAIAREKFVDSAFNYFSNNPEAINQMITDLLCKQAGRKKSIPDVIYIYHYDKHTIDTFKSQDIMALQNNKDFTFKKSGKYSFKFNGFKFTFAWQNGTGLNNPTIRVFLDEKK